LNVTSRTGRGYRRGVSDQPDLPTSDESLPGRDRLRVRRSPRYGRFLLTGAAVGVLVALGLSLTGPVEAGSSRGALVGYLALLLGLLGGVLGGLTAVVLEWAARRH
jgi:hypothetical protein